MQNVAQTLPFSVDAKTGLVAPATQCLSPNQDARPDNVTLDLIVIHGISLPPGSFGETHIHALFCNQLDAEAHPYFATICDLKVSAHVLVQRDGAVTQFVPFGRRAWHAGVSMYQGRERCNDFSVGIELEGSDDTPYTEVQYTVAAALIDSLRTAYPTLAGSAVVGHSDIAPGRKTDPGASFDWPRLRALMASERHIEDRP
ncbi:MAG: 1,6-anhydro-N-acetylmuramyl-L-alanine amidase AmpD [Pseudomonadota bacterium]